MNGEDRCHIMLPEQLPPMSAPISPHSVYNHPHSEDIIFRSSSSSAAYNNAKRTSDEELYRKLTQMLDSLTPTQIHGFATNYMASSPHAPAALSALSSIALFDQTTGGLGSSTPGKSRILRDHPNMFVNSGSSTRLTGANNTLPSELSTSFSQTISFPPSLPSDGNQLRQLQPLVSGIQRRTWQDIEFGAQIAPDLVVANPLAHIETQVLTDGSREPSPKLKRMNLSSMSPEEKKKRKREQGRERQARKRKRDNANEGLSATALTSTKHPSSISSNTSSENQMLFNDMRAPLSNRPPFPGDANWRAVERHISTFDSSQIPNLLRLLWANTVMSRKPLAIEVLREWKILHLPFDGTDILPNAVDFCPFKDVREILEQPIGVEVTRSSFNGVFSKMSDLVEEWQRSQHDEFIDSFRKDLAVPLSLERYGYQDFSACMASPLNVFRCRQCGMILFCPKLLSHSCLRLDWDAPTLINSDLDDLYKLDKSIALEPGYRGFRTPLRIGNLDFSSNARDVAKNVIKLVGLEAERVTVNEMDEKDLLFACKQCSRTVDGKEGYALSYIFSWKGAIGHQYCYHSPKDAVFYTLSPDQKAEAKLLYVKDFGDEDIMCWSCIHCMEWPRQVEPIRLKYVKSHLKDKHGIETPKINEDYYKDYVKLDERWLFNDGRTWGLRMVLEMDAEECSAF